MIFVCFIFLSPVDARFFEHEREMFAAKGLEVVVLQMEVAEGADAA
jgi:hypothetical protein